MEALSALFRVDILLRHFLGGSFFFLVLWVNGHGGWHNSLSSIGAYFLGSDLGGVALTAILVGSAIVGLLLHAIQRSTLGIVVELIREPFLRKYRDHKWLFETEALSHAVWRNESLEKARRSSELYTFGSTAHCLYTCAIAVVVADFLIHPDCPCAWSWSIFLCLSLMALGFLTDCRKFRLEQELIKNEKRAMGERVEP
jgi:hypothetical protein